MSDNVLADLGATSKPFQKTISRLRSNDSILQILIIEFSFQFGPILWLAVSRSMSRFGFGTRSLVTKKLSWHDHSSQRKGLLRAFCYRLNEIDCLP